MGRIVIALGGNALDNGKSTIDEQIRKANDTFSMLSEIINSNDCAVTYGNGPQVGEIYTRAGYPLYMAGAMSQGFLLHILYMAYKTLEENKILKKSAVPLITHTKINPEKFTMKPIGPFFDHKIDDSYAMEIGKGYRKMVKSPEPLGILEKDSILSMISNGYVPVAVGGGGIPVTDNQNGYNGFDGVIDKDLSSSLLATSIGAS
ncbi:amino acid kinase family protein, partial [Acidiplasma aeolicum]